MFFAFYSGLMACPAERIPGIAIGIVQNGETLYTKGYGLSDADKGQAVDENTIFGIGWVGLVSVHGGLTEPFTDMGM